VVKEFLVYKSRERIRQFDDNSEDEQEEQEEQVKVNDDTSLFFEDLDMDLDEDDFILIDSNLEGGEQQQGQGQGQGQKQGQQQQRNDSLDASTTAIERLEQARKIPRVSNRPICKEISSKEAFKAKLSIYRGCCLVYTARLGKIERAYTL
jgi:hypothetical protein